MAHQRKLIRAAVETRLKAAGTVASQRVFGNRARQVYPAEMPCIVVYTKSDPAEISAEAPREYKRQLSLVLELVMQASKEETLDDSLDDFCEQVENAIFTDETFGGLVSDTVLSDCEMDILVEGEKPIGGLKITLTMTYYQQLPAAPAATLSDFGKAVVKTNLAPMDGTIDSEDQITVPTS